MKSGTDQAEDVKKNEVVMKKKQRKVSNVSGNSKMSKNSK